MHSRDASGSGGGGKVEGLLSGCLLWSGEAGISEGLAACIHFVRALT
jgi:hypothetical protein